MLNTHTHTHTHIINYSTCTHFIHDLVSAMRGGKKKRRKTLVRTAEGERRKKNGFLRAAQGAEELTKWGVSPALTHELGHLTRTNSLTGMSHPH
jgi:hypothetical protein